MGKWRAVRLIYLTPFFPYPPHAGFTVRAWQTLRVLSAEHEVHVISQEEPNTPEALDRVESRVSSVTIVPRSRPSQGRSRWDSFFRDAARYPPGTFANYAGPEAVRAITSLAREPVDWLICETQLSGQVAFSPALAPLRKVLIVHDIYSDYLAGKIRTTHAGPYKAKYILDRWKTGRHEAATMRCFELNVAVSELEASRVRSLAPDVPVITIPNGVDTRYYSPGGTAPAPHSPRLLFVGNLSYEPNADAIRYFLSDIWPLIRAECPDAGFTAAGNYPPDWLLAMAGPGGGISVPGPLDDLRPLYREAAVVVAPVRYGAGTKLKVIEALAMERPVVTTTAGIQGLPARPGEHLLVADSPEAFAANVLRVLRRPDEFRAMAAAGRQVVARHYDWAPILSRFEAALMGQGTEAGALV